MKYNQMNVFITQWKYVIGYFPRHFWYVPYRCFLQEIRKISTLLAEKSIFLELFPGNKNEQVTEIKFNKKKKKMFEVKWCDICMDHYNHSAPAKFKSFVRKNADFTQEKRSIFLILEMVFSGDL